MIRRPAVPFAVQIGFAAVVTLVLAGAVVLRQVDHVIRQAMERDYTNRVESARQLTDARLASLVTVVRAGAIVLSEEPPFAAALASGDVRNALLMATRVGEQAGDSVEGTQALALYDAGGHTLVRTADLAATPGGAGPPEVIAALASGSTLAGVRTDRRLGLAAYGIAVVHNADGAIVGAVEVLAGVNDAFAARTAELSGALIIFFNEGTPLASSDPHTAFDPRGLSAEQQARLQQSAGYVDLGSGREYLSSVLPITDASGAAIGFLYAGVERRLVVASVDAARRRVMTAFAGAGVIGLGLTALLTVLAVRPLSDLVGAARRIQSNDLDSRVPVAGPREARELGEALDAMRLAIRQGRETLQMTNRSLEEQVHASSTDLTEATMDLAVIDAVLAEIGRGAPTGIVAVAESLARLTWADGAVVALETDSHTLESVGVRAIDAAVASQLLDDIRQTRRGDEREALWVQRTTSSYPELARRGILGFAATPMSTPGGIAGVVVVTSSHELAATPGRRQLLETVAHEVSAALEINELATEVAENRRIAESVLREMSEGVLLLDRDGVCQVCNPAAALLLGGEPEAIVGRSAGRLLPTLTDRIQELRAAPPNLQRTPPDTIEIHGRSISVNFGPFHGHANARLGTIVLLRDLSAETAAERAKRDFVSVVGHELRTPLTLIRTSIDLLNEPDAGALNATQRRIVDVLQGNSTRLMTVINDLLDISALDARRMEIDPQLIDLRDTVADVVDTARPAAVAKRIELITALPDEAVLAWGDYSRIAQVMGNLLTNAIKYTPDGGRVSVRVIADDPEFVRVEVTDNGIGIAPADCELVFEKFFRTTEGRRTTSGTGLGLPIARSIIERHGGRIWCESGGGAGSTFVFTLPRERAID